MAYYLFNPKTKQFTGQVEPNENPTGGLPLIPESATTTQPPSFLDGQWVEWNGVEWEIKSPDGFIPPIEPTIEDQIPLSPELPTPSPVMLAMIELRENYPLFLSEIRKDVSHPVLNAIAVSPALFADFRDAFKEMRFADLAVIWNQVINDIPSVKAVLDSAIDGGGKTKLEFFKDTLAKYPMIPLDVTGYYVTFRST